MDEKDTVEMDSKTIKDFVYKLNIAYDYVTRELEIRRNFIEEYEIDMYHSSLYLRVSQRTLKRRIDENKLKRSNEGYPICFKIKELRRCILNGTIKSTIDDLQLLIDYCLLNNNDNERTNISENE